MGYRKGFSGNFGKMPQGDQREHLEELPAFTPAFLPDENNRAFALKKKRNGSSVPFLFFKI